MVVVDTHAHLQMSHFKSDREEIIERFNENGILFIINVGTNITDSRETVELSKKYEKVFAAIGVHPHDSKDVEKNYIEILEKLSKNEKVVAIGEIGLDYYRNFSPQEVQQKVFVEQLLLAKELKLPIVVHIRDAYEEAYNILESFGPFEKGGVIHSFSANSEWALKFVKLGFYLGISGPITYKRNEQLREVVKLVGEQNILSETDCPYLTPHPYRGKRNEPAYVGYVVKKINDIIGYDVSETLVKNARSLFGVNL
ncbi:TatD family hydrolase [Thermosipho atlanticus]|uniref:TatD DNase family protein n=1 Tax=Thermosipho atlanticus DSM 15807 TaxID=1123380 RepID=A0A1M5TK91_9BACT|nr:TatD family hydrolase [Thermosipho atlanticus]SHH51098.1 TatD DNase family protein [Thermosipho atlanticus DSM 15807]